MPRCRQGCPTHEMCLIHSGGRRRRATVLPRGPRDVLLVSSLSAEPAPPVIRAAARDRPLHMLISKQASGRAS